MSSSRQLIPVCFDQSTSRRVVIVGAGTTSPSLGDPDSKQQITLYYGTKSLFYGTIYTAAPSIQYNPDPTATWLFGIDDVPFSDTSDYVLSQNDVFNLSEDWSEVNPNAGKICFRVDLDTNELKTRLKAVSTPTATMYGNLWMLTAAGNVLIASWLIYIAKTYVDPTTAKPVEGVTHLTTDAAAASYVPQWGDQARWRWKNGGWQYQFEEDGKFRSVIGKLVNGQGVFTFGDPEA